MKLMVTNYHSQPITITNHTSETTESELYTAASFYIAKRGVAETSPHSDATSLLQQKLCVSEEPPAAWGIKQSVPSNTFLLKTHSKDNSHRNFCKQDNSINFIFKKTPNLKRNPK